MVVPLHATVTFPISLPTDYSGGWATLPVLLSWVLLAIGAIVAVIVAGPKQLSRKHHKQEELSEISPKTSVYKVEPETEPQAQ